MTRFSFSSRLLLVALLLAVASGCDGLPTEEEITGNVVEQLDRRRGYDTLSDAIAQAGLASTLTSGAYTILAPTDIAFEYTGSDFLSSLLDSRNRTLLTRVLRHHVIAGRLAPEDFVDGATFQTLDGRSLQVKRTGPFVRVGGVSVDVAEGIEAEGSMAYPTGDVLLGALTLRERVTLSPSLSRFLGLSSQASLLNRAENLDTATLLAPINDAITALGGVGNSLFDLTSNVDVRDRVLEFHLVPGTPALANGQSVTTAEGAPLAVSVNSSGVRTIGGQRILREENLADGRLLVLGGVVLEPLTVAQRLRIEPTLLRYWQEVRSRLPELWTRLQDEDEDITVFVPTNLGYDLRGNALNNALTDAQNAALNQDLLRIHVVEGLLTSEDLFPERQVTGFDGTVFTFGEQGTAITLDGKRLGEIRRASNGAFYTLNAFLLPRADVLDTALLQGFTRHVQAVRQSGLEAFARTPGTTLFVASDALYDAGPGRLVSDPGPFIRYNATEATITEFESLPAFTTLDGANRSIRFVTCPTGEEADDFCSPYQLPDATQVYQGSGATDGSGAFHILRTLSLPPGF